MNSIDPDEEASKFYQDGKLYGALYKDSAICGNYAALVEALMDRLDIPQRSYFANSSRHAWNVIKIDGEPYYVDATWLDNFTKSVQESGESYNENGDKVISISFLTKTAVDLIKEGNVDELRWYKESIDDKNISSIDKNNSHDVSYLPDYVTKVEKEEVNTSQEPSSKSTTDLDKKVKIQIGTKEIIIGAGALVGILGLVGGTIIAVKKKREKEERRRRMMSMWNNSGDYFSDDFSSSRGRRY